MSPVLEERVAAPAASTLSSAAEDGFQTTDGRTLAGAATSGDRFGSSLAIAPSLTRTGFDLWIGAPLDNVGGATDAGSVSHYSLINSGGVLEFELVQTITQNSPGLLGRAETNDQFDAALSATA